MDEDQTFFSYRRSQYHNVECYKRKHVFDECISQELTRETEPVGDIY